MRRLAFLLLVLFLASAALSRTWTDSTGKYTTDAELREYKGGFVYLKKQNGSTARVPIGRLSQADQAHVKTVIAPANMIAGKVVAIADGDTLTLLDKSRKQHKIRLVGIDAPESTQAFGIQAKNALAAKVFQKDVVIEWREEDKYGRTLGDVILDGRWINHEMVEEGWSWHYKHFSKSEMLAEAETKARGLRAALWKDEAPTAPWDFRSKRRPRSR
jgi:endonuclease YncB( thermonuclease family)